mgnify:CR=1 FL=1
MEEAVLFSVENHVATITLNRPKSLNSMNDKLIDGLHEALDRAEQDEEIRCVVLTGSGKAFCAGGDLPFLEALPAVPLLLKWARLPNALQLLTNRLLPWLTALRPVQALI